MILDELKTKGARKGKESGKGKVRSGKGKGGGQVHTRGHVTGETNSRGRKSVPAGRPTLIQYARGSECPSAVNQG